MKNIEYAKKQFINFFSEKYYQKIPAELTESEMEVCSSLSEVWAYIYKVVPEEHGKFTIFNFDGYVTGKLGQKMESKLPDDIVQDVRNKICKFCWDIGWEEINSQSLKDENINSFLRKRSAMMKRFKSGSNIVIFGASNKPVGRTMLASIVMKEAIRLRAIHRDRGQTYDWIDFSKLCSAIEKETDDLVDYKSCDWLVVDNILRRARTSKHTTFLVDKIDPFFINRYSNKQPTILVFKFDIRDENFDMEKSFGIGISRILDSKRTLKIPLNEYTLSMVDD